MKTLKIIVEKHSDGYVAYPLGLQGAVVAEGDAYEEALADAKSAAQFHEALAEPLWTARPPSLPFLKPAVLGKSGGSAASRTGSWRGFASASHIETFGPQVLAGVDVLEAFVAETWVLV